MCNSKKNLQLPHKISRAGDWEQENVKSFALYAMVSLILLPFVGPQWSCFYQFQGLMGLCNIWNLKCRKRNGFNICEKKSFFINFDMDLTYFSVMSFLCAWYSVLLAQSV